MAFFKFRRSGSGTEPAATPVQPESIEAMRRRAKHRLLGAAVLVLIGVIGLPMLFDKQPRPISVDIPIEIPDRNKVKPLNIPEPVAAPASQAEASAPKTTEVAPSPITAASQAPKALITAQPKTADTTHETAEPKPVKPDDGTQAQALLDGKDSDKKVSASTGRFVVQVGAFADAARARDVRQKVEHAGLKTYTQVAETKDGRRIRVRVGPFATKAEADKAIEKIKKLGLPASILTL